MSQTACPHCGSTNSIETAGQRYCADCGQLITVKKEAKPEKVAEKKVATKADKKPAVKAVAQKAPVAKPKKTVPALNLKAIEEARSPKAIIAKKPGALDLRGATPKPAVKRSVGRHVPPKPQTVEKKLQPIISEAPIAEIRVPVPSKKFRHKLALRDALKSVFAGKTLGIALAATIITTICEVAFVVMFAQSGQYAITETIKAGSINAARATTLVGHFAWASLLGFVGYLVYHYALAEIIFRTSRAFDRRNATAAQAQRAALGSLAGLFAIDLTTWMLAIISIALVAGANLGFLGTKSLGLIGVVLAVLINVLAVYVWLGLISARHMASYAIVLGQVGVRRAYSTGWALYNREFGRITTGLVVITLVSFLIALPASIFHNLLGTSSTLTLASTTAVTALTQAVIMIVGVVYFLRLYRFVIAREYDSELGHLLSGRQPRKSHVGRRLIALGFITIVWVAVATSLIIYATPLAKALFR